MLTGMEHCRLETSSGGKWIFMTLFSNAFLADSVKEARDSSKLFSRNMFTYETVLFSLHIICIVKGVGLKPCVTNFHKLDPSL